MKNCRRKHDKQQTTQQRIEGDFDALFRGNKAAQNEVCAPMPRPLRSYSLLADLPICLLCRTPRQIHEFSVLIFVCKTECAQKKIEKSQLNLVENHNPRKTSLQLMLV